MADATTKYTIAGIIGTIILIVASSTLYISDYRAILIDNPGKLAVISYQDTLNRIELLTKEAPPGIEFTRFLYRDDYVKVYYGSNLVATSSWEVFDGSRKLIRGRYDPVTYQQKEDGSFVILMGTSYYNDTAKSVYVGKLTRTIEVYPRLNKETIEWTPESQRKYGLHWVVLTKQNGTKDFLKEQTNNNGNTYPIVSWEDSHERVSSAKQTSAGKITINYKTMQGVQKIDPVIISAAIQSNQSNIVSCTVESKTEQIGINTYRFRSGQELYDTSTPECLPITQAINISQQEGSIRVQYKNEIITITPAFKTANKVERLKDLQKADIQISHETVIKTKNNGYFFEQNLTSIPKTVSDSITDTGYEINYSGTGSITVTGNKIVFPNNILVDFDDYGNGTVLSYNKGYLMKQGFHDKLDPTVTLNTSTTNLDTWINGASASRNLNFGADEELSTGGEGGSSPKKALLWINVSTIPAGSTIDNATLTLHKFAGAVTGNVTAYEILQSWNVGTRNAAACSGAGDTGATWNNRTCTANPWNTAGMGEATDYDSFKVWNTTVTSTTNAYFTWNITYAVNEWVQGTLTNNGLVFIDSGGSSTAHSFDSMESATLAFRPSVFIEYTLAATECAPTAGQDWIITDEQRCTGATVNLPGNSIYVRAGGQLICNGGTNITSLNGVESRGCSGMCEVYGNTGSPQGGCTVIAIGG